VLCVEDTVIQGENHRYAESLWQTLLYGGKSNTFHNDPEWNTQHMWWWVLVASLIVNPDTIEHDGPLSIDTCCILISTLINDIYI
jgi:hypothetical protein